MDEIAAAVKARPDSANNYSAIYKVIGDVLERHEGAAHSDIANWIRGAEQINAGRGACPEFIRTCTEHQMKLRGIGDDYNEDRMQDASNGVARRAIADIFNSGLNAGAVR